jgi:DNA polymerase
MAGEGRSGQENDPLMQEIHTLIKPPVGYVVCTVDSKQIEARLLAWLAGQQDLLDGFAKGEDVYSQFATGLFRHPVRSPRKTDPKPLYIMLKIRRGFGKDTILGAGYGMGATRFYDNCLSNPTLRPLFDSGQYDFMFVKKLIDTYRTTYSKIPEYWRDVECAFRQCLRFPHLEPKVGCTKFYCKGTTVHIQLPSGRVLYYRHAKLDKKNSIKYHDGALWGGSITENIDQAIARDLLGYWILECEKAGIPITLHIHDDTRSILPKDQAEEIAERQAAIMRTIPAWAEGLPVDTEIKIGETL